MCLAAAIKSGYKGSLFFIHIFYHYYYLTCKKKCKPYCLLKINKEVETWTVSHSDLKLTSFLLKFIIIITTIIIYYFD